MTHVNLCWVCGLGQPPEPAISLIVQCAAQRESCNITVAVSARATECKRVALNVEENVNSLVQTAASALQSPDSETITHSQRYRY